nr:unnamed protein product [Callosobruchus analis]
MQTWLHRIELSKPHQPLRQLSLLERRHMSRPHDALHLSLPLRIHRQRLRRICGLVCHQSLRKSLYLPPSEEPIPVYLRTRLDWKGVRRGDGELQRRRRSKRSLLEVAV